MRKIRIGNDIRLKLKIEPNTQAGFDKIDEFDQSSVKQLRCYLINTSYFRKKKDDVGPKPFLRVGFPEFYHPSHHNINNAGFPSYHMRPANLCNYDRFEPDFHEFHWWPGYRGFGLHPEHFHDHCLHLQHGPRPKPSCCGFYPWCNPIDPHIGHPHFPMHDPVPPCAEPHHPEPEPYDIYGRTIEDHRHPNPFLPYYLADSQVTNVKNTLTCFFPAVQQKLCGTYKLVVVLTVFEQGWGRHNLRTYTIDRGDVFELVDDETGESGAITIDTDATGERENPFKYIYAESDNYVIASNSDVRIGDTDSEGRDYDIYSILDDDTTVLYNPYDWHFPELVFESSNDDIVSVDKFGTLHAHDINTVEETVTITVHDIDNNLSFNYTVTVKQLDTIKIGFDSTEDALQMSASNPNLGDYSCKNKIYSIANIESGRYLWIFSQRRIHYIKAVEDENEELAAELSSGFRVPMTNAVLKDGYFCYRSAAPILSGDMNIKIKFA